MLLAEAAQVADGKLYILGAGWSQLGAGPSQMAVAVLLEFTAAEAGGQHHFELFLTDSDHQPVFTESATGSQPVEVRGDAAVSLPPDYDRRLPVPWPIAVNVPGLSLVPGRGYQWNLVVDGETQPEWVLPFRTLVSPPAAPPSGDGAVAQ
jgi:hypothetical protein